MPYTEHDECHSNDSAVLAEYVHKDLKYRLPVWRANGVVKILDAEEKTDNVEEAKDGGNDNAREDADWCGVGGAMSFFRKMGRSIKTCICQSICRAW